MKTLKFSKIPANVNQKVTHKIFTIGNNSTRMRIFFYGLRVVVNVFFIIVNNIIIITVTVVIVTELLALGIRTSRYSINIYAVEAGEGGEEEKNAN